MIFLLAACTPKVLPAAPPSTPKFDPAATWEEFEAVVREAYAYLDRDDFSADAQLAHTRSMVLAASTEAEVRSILHRSTFAFTDPHFIVGPFVDSDPNIFPTSSDLVLDAQDGGFVVADVRALSAADRAGIRPGWRVRAIGDLDIEAAIEDVWQGAVEARTPAQRAYAATLAVNGKRTGTRTLTFESDDSNRIVELANPRDFAQTLQNGPAMETSFIEGNGWIRIQNTLGDRDTIAAFDAALDEVGSGPGLIIDLRNTPSGGNTDVARAIIGHFITEPQAYQVHEIPAVERATTVPRRFVEQVLPRAPHYPGKVAVLGGAWTGSMGEGLVIGLHAAAGARTFGSDMGDLLGGLHNVELETAAIRVDLGVERLFHVDGTPREDFIADVPLPRADRAVTGEGDPALLPALDWLAE